MLRSLTASPALRAAVAFGMGGVAFTLGNLVLARVMPPSQYGLVSLVLGIVSVVSLAAPLGLDLSISRHGLLLDRYLRHKALCASVCTSLIATLISGLVYALPVALLLCIFVAACAGGVAQTVSAHFQGQHRFARAVPFLQISNWALVPVAIATALFSRTSATVPSAIAAAIVSATALWGWQLTARETRRRTSSSIAELWKEALALMTIHTASAFFLQLERLIIPVALGMESVAMIGVLAALVGSPFRMIQAAVMFTVVPRLRTSRTPLARRALVLHELALITVVMLVASTAIWFIAPPLATWLLAGRYLLSAALLLPTLIIGFLRVLSAFGTATVTALAPEKQLRVMSVGSWLSIAIASVAALLLAPWGLSAVLYGIAIGWLTRCCIALGIALPHLRQPPLSAPAALRF